MEYVRVCNVGGITGWTLPGSDTCVKFSGYMTAHVIGGNLSSQYNDAGAIASAVEAAVNPFASAHLQQILMVQGGDVSPVQRLGSHNCSAAPPMSPDHIAPTRHRRLAQADLRSLCDTRCGRAIPNQKNAIFNRDTTGWNIRANFGFDMASNTAYGPLIGHFDINSELGNGLDSPRGSATYVNRAM